jgi:hypothetical protein
MFGKPNNGEALLTTEEMVLLLVWIVLYAFMFSVVAIAPIWIGRAARKRGKGFLGWIVCGYLFSPIVIGIIYLCTAHRAPILLGHENDVIF